ncbi:hypothetical protein MRX96_058638 [Rhipicephalus microplus]
MAHLTPVGLDVIDKDDPIAMGSLPPSTSCLCLQNDEFRFPQSHYRMTPWPIRGHLSFALIEEITLSAIQKIGRHSFGLRLVESETRRTQTVVEMCASSGHRKPSSERISAFVNKLPYTDLPHPLSMSSHATDPKGCFCKQVASHRLQ